MSAAWNHFFAESLQRAENRNRKRSRSPSKLSDLIDFGSNDYLGLRSHPAVLQTLRSEPITAWGTAASPVLSGYSESHRSLEQALAKFSDADSALVFSSGFACNVGAIACLASQGDLILSDALNHASLIDGCRLSKATTIVFPHTNFEFVRETLERQRHKFAKTIVLTESIFSMDGDAAPLAELASITDRYDAGLVVDEAHAVGVYGEHGSGLLEEYGLQSRVLAKLGTLSKALGGVGGYVAGSAKLIEFLVNHCRSYLFSTAPPALSMAAAEVSLQSLIQMREARGKLRQTSRELRRRIMDLGFDVTTGESPILPIIVGGEKDVLALSSRLREAGIYVPAIRPPTVPEGTCRLRISLSIRHTESQLESLLAALRS